MKLGNRTFIYEVHEYLMIPHICFMMPEGGLTNAPGYIKMFTQSPYNVMNRFHNLSRECDIFLQKHLSLWILKADLALNERSWLRVILRCYIGAVSSVNYQCTWNLNWRLEIYFAARAPSVFAPNSRISVRRFWQGKSQYYICSNLHTSHLNNDIRQLTREVDLSFYGYCRSEIAHFLQKVELCFLNMFLLKYSSRQNVSPILKSRGMAEWANLDRVAHGCFCFLISFVFVFPGAQNKPLRHNTLLQCLITGHL